MLSRSRSHSSRGKQSLKRFLRLRGILLLPLCFAFSLAFTLGASRQVFSSRRSALLGLLAGTSLSSKSFGGKEAWAADEAEEAARKQLVAGAAKIDELLERFDELKKSRSADEIREYLKGSASPLLNIEPKLRVLAVAAKDPEVFQEAAETFIGQLGQADMNTYSSVFAGSGDPKKQNMNAYLDAARKEILVMQKEAQKMLQETAS
eukprot:TRINITY_DN7689_c0_g5_i1.p1 TRINITY_DN7689_c0_g5~~TRINITY_DN7689_c0_g5_i1.p1  ORF type:complete len:206 (-),score=44.84 TRINITY_DN7689_c0_g5_i1:84-701(-)